MPLTYASGERIEVGDHVRYDGELGQIEFVVESPAGVPDVDWYFGELGPGVMVREPKVFGRVYVADTRNDALLEFVERQRD